MKIYIAACALLIAVAPAASAQDTLPEGPGKEQTLRLCGACHEAAKATSVKLTREGWIETIDRMKAFGASGADEDFAAVLEYLATNFKGETVRPLDMNTAEAIDLESVLQLLRRESKAVLDYRAKRGQFTSLDDLKGLDPAIYKKIEAKKDRIVFQTQRQQ
jgi:DNA uptake protein ComE-like DNA-binding protein